MGEGKSHFGVLDYAAVVLTLVISLGIGVYHAAAARRRGKGTKEDMLIGGRKMKSIPIAISMIVTYFSAICMIGYPSETYSNGIQIFWMHMILVGFTIPLSAFSFTIVLQDLKLTSAYEYLELRFDSAVVRCFASAIFTVQMTMMTSIALYAPSIALEAFLGLPAWVSIVGIGICGTVYTSFGGFKAVVWTDVFQFVLIIIGMSAIVLRGFYTAGGVVEAFSKANAHGRLNLFNWNIDPFERYNTVNLLLGYSLSLICFFGTYQPNVQRYSSLPSLKEALKAMAWNTFLKEIMDVLIISAGVSIFATYATCDPIKIGEIKNADEIVPYFFIRELSWMPGMMGLLTACMISAVLSTLSSGLNSLAAVTWEDSLSKIPYFLTMSTVQKGRVTCLITAMFGAVTIGLAFLAGRMGSIFKVVLTVVGAFEGTLGSVFIMGVFLPIVNKFGACAGMVAGLFSTGFLIFQSNFLQVSYPSLPTSVEGCSAHFNFESDNNTSIVGNTLEYEWPEKLYTVSYVLYPFIAISVSVGVAVVVSFVGRIFLRNLQPISHRYLHPIVRRIYSLPEPRENGSKKIVQIMEN